MCVQLIDSQYESVLLLHTFAWDSIKEKAVWDLRKKDETKQDKLNETKLNSKSKKSKQTKQN